LKIIQEAKSVSNISTHFQKCNEHAVRFNRELQIVMPRIRQIARSMQREFDISSNNTQTCDTRRFPWDPQELLDPYDARFIFFFFFSFNGIRSPSTRFDTVINSRI